MKKINNWYLPDEENFHKVMKVIESEQFGCNKVIDAASQYVKQFKCAIDVGTWIGDSTTKMCKMFEFVHAFEANSELIEPCKANLEYRNNKNFKLYNIALSNIEVNQKFAAPTRSTSAGWIETTDIETEDRYITVNSKKLDSYNFKDIDFIKIDVDSHEGFLIAGSIDFFKNNNPVVAIEHKIFPVERQASSPNPLEILEKLNYKVVEKIDRHDYILVRE